MSRFCCLFFRHFEAWSARRADASLASGPFAIYARDKIIAASPEALLAGAQVGWTLRRLQSRLPEVRALPFNPTQVGSVWQDVLTVLYSQTPRVESLRPGLAMVDIAAPRIAPLVSEWGIRAGLADNRATAELAAYAARAQETRVIPPGQHIKFYDTLPLSTLAGAGIGAETIERLNWFGWTTVGHIRSLKESELQAQFPKEGRTLYRFAQAADVRRVPVYAPPVSILERFAFDEPARQPSEWEQALADAVQFACGKLGDRQVGKLAVFAETTAGDYRSVRLLREPVSSQRTIYEQAHQMLLETLPHEEATPIYALELRLGGFVAPIVVQEELFESKGRQRAVDGFRAVLHRLESRFPEKMKRAVIVSPHAPRPEERYRYEPALNTNAIRPAIRPAARPAALPAAPPAARFAARFAARPTAAQRSPAKRATRKKRW